LRNQADALVVRDEKVYELPEHGRAEFAVEEGERVEQGEHLAVLFAPSYNERLVSELWQVRERIFAYQYDNMVKYALDSTVAEIQTGINETIQDIQVYLRNAKRDNLSNKERDLRGLLRERQDILDKIVFPDQYLQSLYEQEAEIIRQLGKSMINVEAPTSGIISFSSDGLEKVLSLEAVTHKTLSDIDALIRRGQSLVDRQSADSLPLIRLIDMQKWFVVCILTNTDVFYNEGDEVDLRFLGEDEKSFKGKVYIVSRSNKTSLLAIEIKDDLQAVANTRLARVEISKKKSGLMIPIEALVAQHGLEGVQVAYGNSLSFAPVEVLAFGDKYAIIEDTEDAIEVGINAKVILD